MAQIEIVRGPNADQLVSALLHRKRCHEVYFRVRPSGSEITFRLYVYIEGLKYLTDLEDVWEVTAWQMRPGRELSGLYSNRNRKGNLEYELDTLSCLPIMGFDPDIQERLHNAHVYTPDDLVSKDEVTVFLMMLDQDGRVTTEVTTRFGRLRAQLEQLGISLSGRRHGLVELVNAL